MTEAAVTKPEVPASKKKKAADRTVKLKSSKWYQSAVRSIGITKENSSKVAMASSNNAAASSSIARPLEQLDWKIPESFSCAPTR